MKKRGSALAIVLIFTSILLILGAAISAATINTTKYNKKYDDIVDVELAAKSGLNLVKEDLIKKIKTTTKAEELPKSLSEQEINFSDSLDYDITNIEVTKEIKRIPENYDANAKKYEYTVISKAKGKNTNVFKEEIQVIIVNVSEDGNVEDIIVDPKNFINSKGQVQIKNNTQSDITNYINSGSVIDINGQIFNKDPEPSLTNLNIALNNESVDSYLKSIDQKINLDNNIDTNITFDKVYNAADINNTNIQEFNGKKIKIVGELNLHQKDIESLKLTDTTVLLEGDLKSNKHISIELNNSNFIIMGAVEVNESITINSQNSTLNLKGRIWGNFDGDMYFNNSIFNIVEAGIESNGNLKLSVENNSKINTKERVYANKGIKIDITESTLGIKEGGIESNGMIDLNLGKSSICSIKQRLYSNSGINISLINSDLIIRDSGIETNGQGNIKLKDDSSIYTKERIYSRMIFTINNDKSRIITKEINTGAHLDINIKEGFIWVGINIYSGRAIGASLKNSAIIINGNINSPGQPNYDEKCTLINEGESFILATGTMYFTKVEMKSNSNTFKPSNSYVINNINNFVVKK